MNKNNDNEEYDMIKEVELVEKIIKILKKDYGFPPKQIGREVFLGEDSGKRANVVVFDEKKKPRIIVEVKTGNLVLPLFEHQLSEYLKESKAEYGILYNGKEKKTFQLKGNSLLPIKDIPKKEFFDKIQKILNEFKPLAATNYQIKILADIVRRDFYQYTPFLQIVTLKILDETEFKGKLFEEDTNKSKEEKINELFELGKRTFPNLFGTHRVTEEKLSRIKFYELFDTVKEYSLLKSDKEAIRKIMLKLLLRDDWIDYPKELSNLIFDLIDPLKNKKILIPYARYGPLFDLPEIFEKKYKLTKSQLNDYVTKNLAGVEVNTDVCEILEVISKLYEKEIKLVNKDYLFLNSKEMNDFEYIFCFPPIGADISSRDEIRKIYGNYGRTQLAYIIKKLQNQKNLSKVALLVPPSFLAMKNLESLRLSLAHPGYLRAIIQFPQGIALPQTGISMSLIILNFKRKEGKENWNRVFLSDISTDVFQDKKLRTNVLRKIKNDFQKFEQGKSFKASSESFHVHQNDLIKTWTVSDKTPELQKIIENLNGIELEKLGKIWFGKPSPVDSELDSKKTPTPYLRIQDIENGFIKDVVSKTIYIQYPKQYSDFLIKENDILLSCQGTVGKIGITRKKDVGILPSPQIAVIRADPKKIIPKFLAYVLNSESVQEQLKIKSKANFISRINMDNLNSLIIPKTPLNQQKKKLVALDNKLNNIEKLEKQLKAEKQNLFKFDYEE